MQYCIYLRKSRADVDAESRGEGETLARHERALVELSRRQQLPVGQIYREIVSGETIAARPVMQQLLTDVEQGLWAGVLVMEVERLARGETIDQGLVAQTFKYSNTRIVTPGKTYDPANEFDEEYFEFGLFMSRREYKTINRRLQAGRYASVKEGKYVGSRPPYGYERVKLPHDKGWTLEPIPEQADVVRMIFDLYTRGEPYGGELRRLGASLITRRLNALKIPPQRGEAWAIASVQGILRNPVYMGAIRWNRRPVNKKMVNGQIKRERPIRSDHATVSGVHPAIVDADTFELAQRYMSSNPPRPLGERGLVSNPLAGLIVCGKCGHKMQRRPYQNGQPASLICQYTSCDNVSSAFHLVEERVLDGLSAWLAEYKLSWSDDDEPVPGTADVTRSAIKKIDAEMAELSVQLGSLHDLLERGVYDADTFISRSQALKERVRLAEADKHALVDGLREEAQLIKGRADIIPKIEQLLTVYHELPSAAAKNDMLKEVVERILYTKELNSQRTDPSGFVLRLYPKVPLLDGH